jgi:hypothetical protein
MDVYDVLVHKLPGNQLSDRRPPARSLDEQNSEGKKQKMYFVTARKLI